MTKLAAIWEFLTANWKITLIVAACIFGLGYLAYLHHEIYQSGYNDCSAKYDKEALARQEHAAAEIKKTGAQYATIKNKIVADKSLDPAVGRRVTYAIDSLRPPEHNAK